MCFYMLNGLNNAKPTPVVIKSIDGHTFIKTGYVLCYTKKYAYKKLAW